MLATIGKQTLRDQMLLIRVLEDELQTLCLEGLAGDLHFSKGQEAIPVGVCAAMRETDYLVTHHRTIAHAVAKGVPLEALVAELLGKSNGLNGGLAGEMHLSDPTNRFLFCWQLVGTCVPVAAGLAWAVKNYLKSDDVVVCFHGDAATANGQWHEGVNIAAVNKVPLLLVCENNHLAGNVLPEHYQPVHRVLQRMGGYGLTGLVVDGNDAEAVYNTARYALERVRSEGRPFMLECNTTRLGRHKQGQGDLRSKEEIATLARRDPLRGVTIEERITVEDHIRKLIQTVQG